MVVIEFKDRHFLFLVGMLAVISAIGLVTGYGGSNPEAVGHSSEEVEGTVPPGAVMSFAMESCPQGWVECNGVSLSRSEYPELFASIGALYGSADISHFNVPDYRGEFLRGWDKGAGTDPNAATRTASQKPGSTMTEGDHVGTFQEDMFESHHHTISPIGASYVYAPGYPGASSGGKTSRDTTNTGGSETRPKNVYVLYCIKA